MNRITQYLPPDELFCAEELDEGSPFAFDGSNLDPASLTCHQIRHYDPTPGQWLSEEPIGHESDDANVMTSFSRSRSSRRAT